ncbi:MAG TPA: N-acetylmuramoyl-L-alanine amidase [Rhodanobacteraceae bacterium]|nr:N-acetylmuramoyl-L-alanine amidase [Rhodanobacteraceae bacterium]
MLPLLGAQASGPAPRIVVHGGQRRRVWVRLTLAALLLSLAACTALPPRNPLASWASSPNHERRRAQLIVLHFTDETSAAESLHTLQTGNSGGPVSAHYLIGEDGHLYQLVRDADRAWHAGGGRWGTITDVNSASIGIELDNDGSEPFAPAQIDRLLALLTDLTTRLGIPPSQVIGHEDMAPQRKVDPGPLFPWARLAAAGFGLWPDATLAPAPAGFDPWLALAAIGYPLEDRAAAVRAFRHHYRGLDGGPLDTTDMAILFNLASKLIAPAADASVP